MKITYIRDDTPAPEEAKKHGQGRSKKKGGFVVLLIVLSFTMGSLGSLAMLTALPDSTLADLFLKRENLDVKVNRVENLVLEESSAITDVAQKVSPAVVSISATTQVPQWYGGTAQASSAGTGFIITSDGLIVTNKHVVSNDNAEYKVFLADGRDFVAKIIDRDPLNDLAIIKIEADSLPTVELGDSKELKTGQWVVAIGNALGEFSNSVTVGVISAKGRKITASGGGYAETLSDLIQTDAAINPGNSGGPMVNLRGQVVGINTAVASGDAQNIGFAIPIDFAKKAIDSVKSTGEIRRPMLGIRYLPITKEVAQANQLSVDYGIWVLRGTERGAVAVIPSSPADKAGIIENDIILDIDGKRIDEKNSLLDILGTYNPDDKITLNVIRKGQNIKVDVTLGVMK